MARAIITIYTSKRAKMDPQQLLKTSKFYSRSKKCDIEKTLAGVGTPLGSPKVKGKVGQRGRFTSFQTYRRQGRTRQMGEQLPITWIMGRHHRRINNNHIAIHQCEKPVA